MNLKIDVNGLPLTKHNLEIWVHALTAWNCDYLESHPETPRLFDAGVRYAREQPGSEDFRPIPRVLAYGCGDCEDLSAYACADLRVRDKIKAITEVIQIRGSLWHVFVRLPDGGALDPSARLGMEVPRDMVEAGNRKLAARRRR